MAPAVTSIVSERAVQQVGPAGPDRREVEVHRRELSGVTATYSHLLDELVVGAVGLDLLQRGVELLDAARASSLRTAKP